MKKEDLANQIVDVLSKSLLFTPGGIVVYEATKYLFDENLDIEQVFTKLEHRIQFAELRGYMLNVEDEKSILKD